MQDAKATYGSTYCLLEAEHLAAFLDKVKEGKKNRQKLGSFYQIGEWRIVEDICLVSVR